MKSASEYISEATSKANSSLGSDRSAVEYALGGDMLANDKAPGVTIQKESPLHVLMIYMQASGKSNKEIAESTGYTAVAVGNILRQPWARARFMKIAQQAGSNAVQAFLDTQVLPSIERLVEIRDEGKGAVSVAAANSILDRALGKAVQHVKAEHLNTTDDVLKERAELERELLAVRSELGARGLNAEQAKN
jgi:hypothetical protein